MQDLISRGDYVLIQRQDYMKLHRLNDKNLITLGKNKINVSAVIGQSFLDQFKINLSSSNTYTLEKVDTVHDYRAIDIKESGRDNRHIQDDGTSQALSKAEIERLQEDGIDSKEILQQLVTNSKTFEQKTEYSQEKYLKKKQKKYYGYITVRRPSIRLLANVYFKLEKTLGIRIDDLSQILTYLNVQSGGKFVLYDSGTSGLLPAALLERIGGANNGQLVYMYPGNENQRTCLQAMGFSDEHYNRCIPVNVHSVAAWYAQNKTTEGEYVLSDEKQKIFDEKRVAAAAAATTGDKRKLDDENKDGDVEAKKLKRPQWHYFNQAACDVFRKGIDGLIIAAKEHPLSITMQFMDYVKPSRGFVVFCAVREPLQDLYFALVNRKDVTNVKLSSNFMRQYQVLPERSHPLVNMTNGGFLLTGIKLCNL